MTMQNIDTSDTIEQSTEMRDFARVFKAALIMIIRYLERRYHV